MTNESMLRKVCIISNAIDVMNESGLQSISTKEIAKRSGISEGTLFKYFPRKYILLQAVLEHYSQYDDDVFNTAMTKAVKPKEALIFYIDFYAGYYENYPAITVITQSYDLLSSIPEIKDAIYTIYNKRCSFMKELIENILRTGEISEETDSELLAEIFYSTCRGVCLRWRMSGYAFSLREKLLEAVNLLLDAYVMEEKV